jgi:hypothetical protein
LLIVTGARESQLPRDGRAEKSRAAGPESSDIVAIAQDDQLDDEIVVRREIKGQDERVWQAALIKISINIGSGNKVVVVLNDFRNCDRQSFADNVSLCPVPNGRFAPVVT